jgi:predicted DNA-binding transcriptional regulator YafY
MSEREAQYTTAGLKPNVRLIYIERLLRSHPRTTDELATLCGVSVRTIRRDLADLQAEPIRLPLYQGWIILDRICP